MYRGTHLVDVQTSVDLLSGNSIAAPAAARDERMTYRCAKKSLPRQLQKGRQKVFSVGLTAVGARHSAHDGYRRESK